MAKKRKSTARRPVVRPPGGSEPANPGIEFGGVQFLDDIEAIFPIVGVGASAGGIEATEKLLRALPADTGMAFVVVQHLDPVHESRLPQILARSTQMRVVAADDKVRVEPNCVYVIPQNRNLVIEQDVLVLSPRTEVRGQHRPIDLFLRSLAEDRGYKALGVVLSGTGSDGTLGVGEIKAAGGITFAQDASAEQTSMPRSAIASGNIDFVLSPEAMAAEIARISRHPFVMPYQGGDPQVARDDAAILRVLEQVREVMGVDFSNYKRNTLHRRITRRMVLHRLQNLGEYADHLQAHPAEAEALYQDILINVTSFFRNPEAYEELKRKVFPQLTADRSRHQQVRVWTMGCSTGEEAYSIAMAYMEYCEESGRRIPMQIFATDLNGVGIERARTGIYSKGIAQDVSPERLRRFFLEIDGSYRIAKPIRDMCVFARQNVLADPPFSHIDLIACRNMLIYMESVLQQKLLPILHYSLRPHGYLWLGSSETIGGFRDLFEVEDAKNKIYSKKPAAVRSSSFELNRELRIPIMQGAPKPATASQESLNYVVDPQKEADRMLLARFAPASVLINDTGEILHFRGDTGPYLAPAPGRASLSLTKMLREGLMVAVRNAIQKAKRTDAMVRAEGLQVKSNGGYREVNVSVLPVKGTGAAQGCLLVLFEDPLRLPIQPTAAEKKARTERDRKSAERERATDARELARLKQELAATRDYLQSVIEQQEAANEELQSANEEVQSANEELQSINEELETSKEEIQSSNEELATVNDELQNRNLELSQMNNDLTNLISSVQMAIVMLGRDLRIRRFTPTAEKLLNLIPADIGRPISDIRFNLSINDLPTQVAEVIDSVSVREMEVQDRQGNWYILRLRPYKTLENQIDGAVLVLVERRLHQER